MFEALRLLLFIVIIAKVVTPFKCDKNNMILIKYYIHDKTVVVVIIRNEKTVGFNRLR